jgi:hypothetical protein
VQLDTVAVTFDFMCPARLSRWTVDELAELWLDEIGN